MEECFFENVILPAVYVYNIYTYDVSQLKFQVELENMPTLCVGKNLASMYFIF